MKFHFEIIAEQLCLRLVTLLEDDRNVGHETSAVYGGETPVLVLTEQPDVGARADELGEGLVGSHDLVVTPGLDHVTVGKRDGHSDDEEGE